jgi:hypothetical protein
MEANKKYVIAGGVVSIAVLLVVFFIVRDNFRTAYHQFNEIENINGTDTILVKSQKITVKYAKAIIAADKTWIKSTDPQNHYKNYYINSQMNDKIMW